MPRPAAGDLLVNCTSAGLDTTVPAEQTLADLGLADMTPPALVVDLVYAAAVTPVAAWGRDGGARVVDGLEILVRQGALSLELWTGHHAPLEVMRKAVR